MDDDDSRTALSHGITEQVRDPHVSGVDRPFVHLRRGQHLVPGVEEDDAQVLLLQEHHVGQEEVGDVLGGADDGALVGVGSEEAAAELHGGQHLGGLRLADGVLRTQLADGGAGQARQAVEPREEPRGLGEDVFAGAPGAQDDG